MTNTIKLKDLEAEVKGIKTSYERQLACLAIAQKGVDSLAKSLAEAKLNLARAKMHKMSNSTEHKSYYELANDMDIEIIHTKYIHAEKYWIVMCKRYDNHYVNWVHANGMFLHGHYFGSQFDNGFVDCVIDFADRES